MKRTFATLLSDWQYGATRPLRTVAGRVGNWRRRRFVETGKGFALERATRPLRSALPVYRDRINPATGRPHRDDVLVYGARDRVWAARADRWPQRPGRNGRLR